MPQIVMTFSVDGEVKVDAQGFKGRSCASATKFIKDALGQVTSETKKLEWMQENVEKTGSINTNLCG